MLHHFIIAVRLAGTRICGFVLRIHVGKVHCIFREIACSYRIPAMTLEGDFD